MPGNSQTSVMSFQVRTLISYFFYFSLMMLFNFFAFQVTAICRNDNPNMFDPFAVEVKYFVLIVALLSLIVRYLTS